MIKWIVIFVILVLAYLSGWRIHPSHGGQEPIFSRSGTDVFSKFNPSEKFDEVTGNKERAEEALARMR